MILLLGGALITLVAIVLLERHLWTWIRASAGDAIVVLPVYATIALVMPRARPLVVMTAALLVAFGVEFSQLYRGEAVDRFRGTLPGRLILGNAFSVSDLVCYVIGAATAYAFDRHVAGRFDRRSVND